MGFVGLTSALGFATKGIEVLGYDVQKEKTNCIANGRVPFLEPHLEEALKKTLGKTFFVADTMQQAVSSAEVILFCVGTPCAETGEANLAYLCSAVKEAEHFAPAECIFTVKSTVPPSTVLKVVLPISGGHHVAMNPEFLREGHAWEDFMEPDRIVLGVENDEAWNVLSSLYECFEAPIYRTSATTAEFIKYLSNSLLATMISFSNEMAGLADNVGNINISDAFHILQEDKRMRGAGISHYIYPGCGYGGSCLPKDTKALLSVGRQNGVEMPILSSVIDTNDNMADRTAEKIISKLSSKEQKVGILGLAFNPHSDDVRSTPAAGIIGELAARGYTNILAYDPVANENFGKSYDFPFLQYCNTAEELCNQCSVAAIVTIWPEFARIDKRYPSTTFVDCRYFLKED